MKLKIWMSAMLLGATCAMAQNPYIAPLGASEQNGVVVVSQPRTTLSVDVTIARDQVLCGPYARYAQKFLGVRAPLNDKTTYSIATASIALLEGAAWLQAPAVADSTQDVVWYSIAANSFPRLQVDKTEINAQPLEQEAYKAATTIFSLRKHRLDLISGDAGENVFGAGLKAALDEIARLEQSYLELFLGKEVVTTSVRRFVVVPQGGKKQYVLCRFNQNAGLLADSDLSGDVVVLQIEPSGNTELSIEAAVRDTNVALFRVADPAVCSVLSGGREYAHVVLPIFEFGRDVKVALPRRK